MMIVVMIYSPMQSCSSVLMVPCWCLVGAAVLQSFEVEPGTVSFILLAGGVGKRMGVRTSLITVCSSLQGVFARPVVYSHRALSHEIAIEAHNVLSVS